MTSYSMGTFCPAIECAPCPPWFVVDIYQILVNVSLIVNLTETEYKAIAKRCAIQEPTTSTSTTTTTTTTAASSTISATMKLNMTTFIAAADTTSAAAADATSTAATAHDINPLTKATLGNEFETEVMREIPSNSSDFSVTSSSSWTDVTTTSMRIKPKTTEKIGLTTGGSKRRHSWPYCNDVCLIIAITSSTCAFLVLLVILALCCRRKQPHDKATSRSGSSQRLVTNDMSNSIDRHGGVVWRHNSGIENLAYRKSLEMREPLKYMESDQNWQDLDYYAAEKDGSLRSNRSSQRNDSSPRKKRRGNKDRRQNSKEKLNQTDGIAFIPLSERKQRSLPKLPSETHVSNKYETQYPNGIRFLSLPRTPKQRNAAEHTRSKSDGYTRKTKQRPRSFEQLNTQSKNMYADIEEFPGQTWHIYSEPNQIRNDLKSKDTNLKYSQNRKTNKITRQQSKPGSQNNVSNNGNISHHRGPNRSFNRDDHLFPASDSNSSPKFYPPYRDPDKQNVMLTTRL